VDTGAQLSKVPGEHLKNSVLYQRDVDLFASVIRGHIQTLSVSTYNSPIPTLDPSAWRPPSSKEGFVRNNQNPEQDPYVNLPGEAVTIGVGGMATHWTCSTPRMHPTIERSPIVSDDDWDRYYSEAEKAFKTTQHAFDCSIRTTLVRETLQSEFSELSGSAAAQNLPLAVERNPKNPQFVYWSSAATILGPLAFEYEKFKGRFEIREEQQARKFVHENGHVQYCEVKDHKRAHNTKIYANLYFACCGAALTPQLLYNSNIRPTALGHYITEQTLFFCQVVLHQELVDGLKKDPRFESIIKAYKEKNPQDPLPIPITDPEPQCWLPVSEGRPWHCQIHRDAFNYGDLAQAIDSRLIVDLRWFGIVKQRYENAITFSDTLKDKYGMPQPSFNFVMDKEDRSLQGAMVKDMLRAAGALGGFLPGSEPQFISPGIVLHLAGSTRMGDKNDGTSVVDSYMKVWDFDNLYVGGNNVINTGYACNPTLTSVALAFRAADKILGKK